jgi:hypothetical protein
MVKANLNEKYASALETIAIINDTKHQRQLLQRITCAARTLQQALRALSSRKAINQRKTNRDVQQRAMQRSSAAIAIICAWKSGKSRRKFNAVLESKARSKANRSAACIQCVMRAFIIRKWWRQLFTAAKKEKETSLIAMGGENLSSAWRQHVARQKFKVARQRQLIVRRELAATAVQRSIRCYFARALLKQAAAASLALRNERELSRVLAYEV